MNDNEPRAWLEKFDNYKNKLLKKIDAKKGEFIYTKKLKNTILFSFIVMLVLGNSFFMLSKVVFYNSVEYKTTPFNEAQLLENLQSFTIRRWDYSETENKMEIELDIGLNNSEGLDKYIFDVATIPGSTDLKTSVILSEPMYAVVQITNVPSNFKAVSFRVSFDKENAQQLKLYTNYKSVNRVSTLPVKTKVDYYTLRLERGIQEYEETIDKLSKDVLVAQGKIEAFKNSNLELEKEKEYLTMDGVAQNDALINKNRKLVLEYEEKISTITKDMQDVLHKKSEAEETLKKLVS